MELWQITSVLELLLVKHQSVADDITSNLEIGQSVRNYAQNSVFVEKSVRSLNTVNKKLSLAF